MCNKYGSLREDCDQEDGKCGNSRSLINLFFKNYSKILNLIKKIM